MGSFLPFRERPDAHQAEAVNLNSATLLAGSVVTGTAQGGISYSPVDGPFYGILRGDTAQNQYGSVQQGGKAVVRVGAVGVSQGQRLMPEVVSGTPTGAAITLATTTGTNVADIGVAESNGTAGSYVEMTISAPDNTRQG